MDPVAVVGMAASVIAAAGVVWERWHWVRTRPTAVLTVVTEEPTPREPDSTRDFFAQISGDLASDGRKGTLINWGTAAAIGVSVKGMHCKLGPAKRGQPPITELAPRSEVKFAIDVDDEDVERAWILVIWTPTSGRRDRLRTAWFPVLATGELAQVRARQLGWRSSLRRTAWRLATQQIATPATAAVGSRRSMPPKELPPAVQKSTPPHTTRWRQWLLTRLQASDSQIVAAAMEPE